MIEHANIHLREFEGLPNRWVFRSIESDDVPETPTALIFTEYPYDRTGTKHLVILTDGRESQLTGTELTALLTVTPP